MSLLLNARCFLNPTFHVFRSARQLLWSRRLREGIYHGMSRCDCSRNERWLSMRRAIEDEHVFRFNPENWEKYLKAQPPSRHIEDSRKFDPTKVLMDTSLQQLEE